MHRFDPVLVVVDPTAEEQPAVGKAARIADKCGARLHLCVCDYEAAFDADAFYDSERLRSLRAEMLASSKANLERMAHDLRSSGHDVTTSAHWGTPLHRVILEAADGQSPGLVVKDTHYHSLLRRSLFTNTDWHLIRDSRWPLLLVKPAAWHEEPRVVAALDPGRARGKSAELDGEILDAAERLRACMGGDLHALHVFSGAAVMARTSSGSPPPFEGAIDPAGVLQAERRRLETTFSELLRARRVHAAQVHLEDGAVVDVLTRTVADLSADVVVMGAISRSQVGERLIGSTAERTLDRLPCDILVVKTTPGTAA